MSKLIEAIETKQNALLEAPTGTGKSMAILCGALAWLEKEKGDAETTEKKEITDFESVLKKGRFAPDDEAVEDNQEQEDSKQQQQGMRIYVASRTHSQINQLVKELRNSRYRPKMVILGSREQYCIHPKVVASKTSKNVECKKLLKEKHGCSYKNGNMRLYLHPTLKSGGSKEVWDIEDLVELGKDVRGCPYFSTRQMLQKAELVFCPYNYLLDPSIRKKLSIKLKDSVVIFDEAHNIESIAADTASLEVELSDLEIAVSELERYVLRFGQSEQSTLLVSTLKSFYKWLEDIAGMPLQQKDTSVYSGSELNAILDNAGLSPKTLPQLLVIFHTLTQDAEKEEDGLVTDHRNFSMNSQSESILGSLFSVFEFLLEDGLKYMCDYRLVISKSEERKVRTKSAVFFFSTLL